LIRFISSAISELFHIIKKAISELVRNKMMWGIIDIWMFRTNIYLSGKDLLKELQQVYGFASPDI
jgi:hypothetical protein